MTKFNIGEKELETLKRKQEEDKWVDITDECSINSSFDVYHGDSLLLQGYSTNYKAIGMRVFKRKDSV